MSVERALLEPVLYKPERAARIPLDRIPRDTPHGALLHAIADRVDHGEMPAGGIGMLIESFRGTEHEAALSEWASRLAEDEPDPGELEAVFVDAIGRLREKDLTREIAALNEKARNGSATPEELREALARKAQSQKTQPSE